jgi:hypothetical protein
MTFLRPGFVSLVLVSTTLGSPVLQLALVPLGPVAIEMRNVHLRADDGIALDVTYLRGQMVSRTPTNPPVFDDPQSYVLQVAAGEVSVDLPSLENLLNLRVFAGPHSPLSDIHVSITKDGRLAQSAKLHKGILTLPISMKATVGAAPDGRLTLHIDTEKTLGIPTTGLLAVFGLTVEDLVTLKNTTGVEIDGNDVLIQIGLVTPPPQVEGRLASVVIRGDRLVETFVPDPTRGAEPLHLPVSARNYLYFVGSVLRFGKLTMNGADLMLVDQDPKTPFDFFPREYLTQLVAGYSKTTASGGLIAYMPDYTKVRREPSRR